MKRGVRSSVPMRGIAVAAVVLAGAFAAVAMAAPTVVITDGPIGLTNDPTPTFEFTATDAELVECSVVEGDTPEFGPCDSDTEHTPPELTDGTWTFTVRATDENDEIATDERTF